MTDSILDSVKDIIGIPHEITDFDAKLILYTNSMLNVVHQEGLGIEGFKITGNTETWDDFLGSEEIDVEWVKGYVPLRVWLIFDVNSLTSGTVSAIKEQIKEFETRYYYEKMNYEYDKEVELNG